MSENRIKVLSDPDTILEAQKEWYKDEIKQASSRNYDFAKFVIGLNGASIAFFIAKIEYSRVAFLTLSGLWAVSPLLCFAVSAIVAFLVALPILETESGHSFSSLYETTTWREVRFLELAMAIWLIGVIFGLLVIADIFTAAAPAPEPAPAPAPAPAPK